jgi:hypothetical protein
MRKLIIFSITLFVLILCGAASLTSVSQVEGNALHTMQNAWLIADETTSTGTEPTALSATERTKKIVDTLIIAASSGDDEISVLAIPAKWNGIRFRAIGITDAGTITHQIYLGTLGRALDCELAHAGQLAWTLGTQQTIYDQITFTLGGADGAAYVPQPGDTVTGNTSGETAVIVSIVETASTWSAGTAAGTVSYRSATGAFTNSETVSIMRANTVLASNAYKHAASDLIDFELADTLVITADAWGSTWSTLSPANDTNAEAELDIKGADYMVVLTSATSVDGKLLIKGY